MRIVVIDSGCSDGKLTGIRFFLNSEGEVVLDSDIEDRVGHGTAVCDIISKHCPEVEFYIVKIFDQIDDMVDDTLLSYVLEYVCDNIECSIVNLSLGIRVCADEERIVGVCQKLRRKGVIVVSAFDNDGAISLPASIEGVIGVMESDSCCDPNHLLYVTSNSILNAFAYGRLQRVKWINNSQRMVQGNSFACAHVTGILAAKMLHDKRRNVDALKWLQECATDVVSWKSDCLAESERVEKRIKRAAIFPFNKETHSLVMFQELLPFDIDSVYDTKYSAHIGLSTDKILGKKCRKDFTVKSVTELSFDSIDTIIIGHIGKLLELTQNREYFAAVLEKIAAADVLVYSFDNLEEFFPETKFREYFSVKNIKYQTSVMPGGMLYYQSNPVLQVCGTSSQQGKFTLQLILRKKFIENGYSVGQLGTEPTSLLFGMDEIYHFGFNNSIAMSSLQVVSLLNQQLHCIGMKKPDIIITGSQGNMLMDNPSNLRYYKFAQTEFLLGTLPDAIILCVNSFDETTEITRNIRYLESIIKSKVVAIVVFPKKIVNDRVGNPKVVKLKPDEYPEQKRRIGRSCHRKVFILGEENDMDKLFDTVVDFFATKGE